MCKLTQEALSSRLARYVEVDYPQVAAHKSTRIRTEPALAAPLGALQDAPNHEIHSDKYVLLAEDLHTYGQDTPNASIDRLLAQLDTSIPTLLLWECVLAYVDPDAANRVMERLFARLPRVAVLCYDMCVSGEQAEPGAPPDRFGRMMLQNLAARRLELVGARKYMTPDLYAERFRALLERTRAGAAVHSGAYSLRHAWQALAPEERHRLSRLEGLDEVEELEMLLAHYCMSWAERTDA